jgi:Ca2+-binding RTX toxin-like protein
VPQYFCTGTAAQNAHNHIIYHSSTGALFYDKDSTGPAGQVQFAVISDKAPLTAANFHVI